MTVKERILGFPKAAYVFLALLLRLALAPFLSHPFDERIFMAVGASVAKGITPYGQYVLQNIFAATPHPHLFGTVPGIGYPPPWGLLCGDMYLFASALAPNNLYAYVFALQIDSTDTSNVWGRWDLNYQFSHGDDAGSFVGGIAPTFLVLRLTQDPPWDTCLGMQLYVPIRADGTWGPAIIYGDQECVPEPAPFTFVADTIIGMFP